MLGRKRSSCRLFRGLAHGSPELAAKILTGLVGHQNAPPPVGYPHSPACPCGAWARDV